MKSYVFPGQGAQFVGMGKDLYSQSAACRDLFEQANDIIGFRISDLMFDGTADDLRQTRVTQPAVFIHSVAMARSLASEFRPDMVGGHSLGEFSALTAAGAMSFADGLRLVIARANAMQRCCEAHPSTMAAVLKLDDAVVEEVCAAVSAMQGDKLMTVVAANYNSPGQVVISGTVEGVAEAGAQLKAKGGRVLPLAVGGAFHSPLMEPARVELSAAIEATPFSKPICPCYQNVDAMPTDDPERIQRNLGQQLASPVRWTATVQHMAADGADEFIELGPGTVLQGLVKKILPGANAH